ADRLRRNHAGSFAEFDQASGGEVASVAHDADSALGLAGEHGTDFHPLYASGLNSACQLFRNLLVDVDDQVAVVVLDLLERHAADDAVTQRLDNLAGFHDALHIDAIDRAAIVFADDDVLRHVDQATRQVTGIGCLECRIRQTFARSVRRNEVLQNVESFAEVRGNGRLDDFAGRLGHQSAHTRELANLLFGSAGTGVRHHVNRVDGALFVLLLHLAEHFVRDLFGNRRPDFDHLVVALAVSDGAVEVLLLDVDHLLLGVAHQGLLVFGNDHVVDADGQPGAGRETEAEFLDFIQHLHRGFQAEPQVGVAHQLPDALLLQQAVNVRPAFGQVIVQDGASYRSVQVLALIGNGFGMSDVLIVVRGHEIDHFTTVAQADGSERLYFARVQRQQHFLDIREGAALAFCARLAFGQVINAKNHVLGGHGDRLSRRRRKDVVRRQQQYARLDLGFRRERDVDRHLITVEVSVERRANQRMNLDGFAFHQHRLESLNTKAVKSGSAVQQHWVVLDDLFQDVPYNRFLLFHHLLGLLDGRTVPGLFEPVIDKRLEQFQRHLFRQAALVQLELGTDDNHRTAGVVDALAEQILTEAALLAFQGVGERLERAVVGATQDAAPASVIEQRVYS